MCPTRAGAGVHDSGSGRSRRSRGRSHRHLTHAACILSWRPILDERASAEAIAVTRDVANRFRTRERVQRALDAAPQQTRFPQSIHWRPSAVSQGFAGLAILCGGVDAALPNEGWDACAHDNLHAAVRGAEQQPRLHVGLYSGLAGLAFTATYLSRGHSRYRRLLATIDAALLPLIASAAATTNARHGVDVATFDVISGLAGVGRYLLLRADEAPHRGALDAVLRALVMLIADHDGLPHWHTPPRFLADNATRAAYPSGNLNCGLAHGIPGPLALLSLAAIRGVVVDGQRDAIGRVADWMARHRTNDQWGVNWPTAVALAGDAASRASRSAEQPQDRSSSGCSRTAWCYGAPGIARALWFASEALADESYRELAIAAMAAVYRRPLAARQIDSPTFCHGVAGLQQITLRFANECGNALFVDTARVLHQQIVDAYEPHSLLGYRNVEPGGGRVDQPGFLDGAAAVPLVLLAAATSVEPRWDALFLLS